MMIAVLALAGCGEGKSVEAGKKAAVPALVQPVQAVTTPQWDVLVDSDRPQAVSDLSGWLIEHGIISNVVSKDGKQLVLIGPFNSQAEAEVQKTELIEKLTKAKKRDIAPVVVEHHTAQ